MNQPSFAWSHFLGNRRVNLVIVPLFWGASLVALAKFVFSEDALGSVIALALATANTVIAFHRRQDLLRSITLYVASIVLLILGNTPDNVVSFCFLAVALSFLVNEKETLGRLPYIAFALLMGYSVILTGVAVLSGRPADTSVLYPELGGFLVIVLIFRDLFLPGRMGDARKPVMRLSDFGLTEREVQILRLTWKGQTSKEIALELCLSEGRVRNQFSRIYRKLKVPGLAELRVLAHSHRIIPEEK